MAAHENSQKTGRHLPGSVSRRDILQLGLAGMGLSALGPLTGLIRDARADVATQKFLVVVFLYGGQDGTNMLIPRTLGNYYSLRPNIAVTPGSELSLDGGPAATTTYGLHPKLVNVGARYLAGEVAPVNLVGYPSANLSHFTSQDIYSFGVRGTFADVGLSESGWMARYADLYAPTALGAVSVGVGRPLELVGGTSNPFLVDSLSPLQVRRGPLPPQQPPAPSGGHPGPAGRLLHHRADGRGRRGPGPGTRARGPDPGRGGGVHARRPRHLPGQQRHHLQHPPDHARHRDADQPRLRDPDLLHRVRRLRHALQPGRRGRAGTATCWTASTPRSSRSRRT